MVSDYFLLSGLAGEANHVTALELFSVLMMMGFCVLGSPEHPEDGKLIQLKWKG